MFGSFVFGKPARKHLRCSVFPCQVLSPLLFKGLCQTGERLLEVNLGEELLRKQRPAYTHMRPVVGARRVLSQEAGCVAMPGCLGSVGLGWAPAVPRQDSVFTAWALGHPFPHAWWRPGMGLLLESWGHRAECVIQHSCLVKERQSQWKFPHSGWSVQGELQEPLVSEVIMLGLAVRGDDVFHVCKCSGLYSGYTDPLVFILWVASSLWLIS